MIDVSNNDVIIKEAEWNFHYGKDHNGKPYMSDNRYHMKGRSSGHFGSGTYFSTYSFKDNNNPNNKYVNNNSTPEFIKVDDGVYRVDMELYKNLYKVNYAKQGYVLYSLLKTLNAMFNRLEYRDTNLSVDYQKAKRNADVLNLKMPSYYDLIKMMKKHHTSNEIKSFSTLFMEYNGFNGVNVSNVPEFDNTMHGSVIYDLSKIDGHVEQVKPKSLFLNYDKGENIVIKNDIEDELNFESIYRDLTSNDVIKINSQPISNGFRVLKNNLGGDKLLRAYLLDDLNETLLSRYLNYVYRHRDKYEQLIRKFWLDKYQDYNWFLKSIEKTSSYYWVNYNEGLIIDLIDNYRFNLPYSITKEEEKEELIEYVNTLNKFKDGGLSDKQKQEIEEIIHQ